MTSRKCRVCRRIDTQADDGICDTCRACTLYECLHCQRATKVTKRGLCQICYKVPDIRSLYKPAAYRENCLDREPTEEELETMIAEQMRCLPEWWYRDFEVKPNDDE